MQDLTSLTPGIEPVPLAVEAQSPKHLTAREVPLKYELYNQILKFNSVWNLAIIIITYA